MASETASLRPVLRGSARSDWNIPRHREPRGRGAKQSLIDY